MMLEVLGQTEKCMNMKVISVYSENWMDWNIPA